MAHAQVETPQSKTGDLAWRSATADIPRTTNVVVIGRSMRS